MTGKNMEDHVDFKKTGLKATIPRLRFLNIFESNREKHLSAEEIYKIMINNGEDIGLATIYRVLTQFEQAGLLLKHHFESGKAVYELNEESHHDHIVCLQCGYVEEFVDSEIEKRQKVIAEENGFNIIDHSLYLYGDCTKKPCPHKKNK